MSTSTVKAIIERLSERSVKANAALKKGRKGGPGSAAEYKKAAKFWKAAETDLLRLLKLLGFK